MPTKFTPISIIKQNTSVIGTPTFLADPTFTPWSLSSGNFLNSKQKYYAKSNTGRYLNQEGANIEMSNKYPFAGGYVTSNNPNKVYLNPNNPTPTGIGEIFVHEYQHLLDSVRPNGMQSLLENKAPQGASYKNTSEDFEKLLKNIDFTYAKYKDKYNLSNDFTDSGIFAELKRIEATLPVGKNIFDTDIGKDISKGLPYFKAGYFNQTRPKTGEIMYSLETALGE